VLFVVKTMIPSDENSCRNRFFPSQKWEFGPHTSFWIGRGVKPAVRVTTGIVEIQ